MSEEKPVFKVRDRRLFNPDGTPREVEQREEDQATTTSTAADATPATSPLTQEPAAATASATEAPAPASAASQAAPEEGGAQASQAQPTTQAQPATTSDAQQPQDFALENEDELMEDVPGADDPASFVNFLMSIASNAAAALGMMEHPATGQRGVDMQLGKHWIEVLGMLHEKTRGNLAAQEQQILEGILADLRMQFVSLTSASTARPSGPRGITGRDIIGGK